MNLSLVRCFSFEPLIWYWERRYSGGVRCYLMKQLINNSATQKLPNMIQLDWGSKQRNNTLQSAQKTLSCVWNLNKIWDCESVLIFKDDTIVKCDQSCDSLLQRRAEIYLSNYILKTHLSRSLNNIKTNSPKMANHVRSPVSVTIPEAVTVDGVTIYKIHVSSILKSTRLIFCMWGALGI